MPVAYVRAFIREYALFLKLDPRQILEAYDVEANRKDTPRRRRSPHPRRKRHMSKHRRSARPPRRPASAMRRPHHRRNRFMPAQNTPVSIEKMRPPHTKRTDTNMTAR